MEWLPDKVSYCKDNGLDLYVIDNYSTDGTWEWLIENQVPCHRFDTNGEFHLQKLQDEMIRTCLEMDYRWIVYLDADLFIYTEKPLSQVIDDCEKDEFINVLEFPRINFFRTNLL